MEKQQQNCGAKNENDSQVPNYHLFVVSMSHIIIIHYAQ